MADSFPSSVHISFAPASIAGETLNDAEREVYTRSFLNTSATISANKSADIPFTSDELIEKAKFVALRLFVSHDASVLSNDFQFVGPVVGPLSKEKFLKAFTSFKLQDAFPDATASYHDFRIDPFLPNRVFYTTVFHGTHTGLLGGKIKPTGRTVRSGPQVGSFTFNGEGKVTKVTIGYIVDRQVGNTGGLGGVFALFYAVGSPLPFPEARPWKKSWQYSLLEWFSSAFSFFKGKSGGPKRIEG